MQAPGSLAGRVVMVGTMEPDSVARAEPRWLDRGTLRLSIVVAGLPVGDLPAGARIRIGDTVIVELGTSGAPDPPGVPLEGADTGGLVEESGASDLVAAEVLEPGRVAPGDGVALEAVALPLTDVLDLHSFRPEDTTKVLSEYLNEARRAGLGEVRIIHGRGRGVQRGIVRRFLSDAPGVLGFAEAPPVRGGWGATVVRLHPAEGPPSA